jgi:hypothetical protein
MEGNREKVNISSTIPLPWRGIRRRLISPRQFPSSGGVAGEA